jgi:hypothetical protein
MGSKTLYISEYNYCLSEIFIEACCVHIISKLLLSNGMFVASPWRNQLNVQDQPSSLTFWQHYNIHLQGQGR